MKGFDGVCDAWSDDPPLMVSTTRCSDGLLVQVQGEVDLATREAFERHLRRACQSQGSVWLDLTDVAFLDPHGARLLGTLQAEFPRLRLGSVSAAVRRSVELLEMIDGVGTGPALDNDEPERDVAPH